MEDDPSYYEDQLTDELSIQELTELLAQFPHPPPRGSSRYNHFQNPWRGPDSEDSDNMSAADTPVDLVGPHRSTIKVARSYLSEEKIRKRLVLTGVSEVKEDQNRLQGVAYIDNVRKSLSLPVKTYDTACVYYHRFRLAHAPDEYQFETAAAAALFTACKIEDTLKKSRDILCAAHNLRHPSSESLTPDDSLFDNPAKNIVGLERLMLEASAFDFRSRYPQKLLIKLTKFHKASYAPVGLAAYCMCSDLYRTFAPLKQTTSTMAIACLELSGRLHKAPVQGIEETIPRWRSTREEVMETILDLLDLYTHHRTFTIEGPKHPIEDFIAIRITLNQEATAAKIDRYTLSPALNESLRTGIAPGTPATPAGPSNGHGHGHDRPSPASPAKMEGGGAAGVASAAAGQGVGVPGPSTSRGRPGLKEGTVRFMLDVKKVQEERKLVDEFFTEVEEEYEEEVEEEVRRK